MNSIIDAILTITAAQVDGVTTLNPGDPAFVTVIVNGNLLGFTFGIPKGNDDTQEPVAKPQRRNAGWGLGALGKRIS